jgi:hypothetical protein
MAKLVGSGQLPLVELIKVIPNSDALLKRMNSVTTEHIIEHILP